MQEHLSSTSKNQQSERLKISEDGSLVESEAMAERRIQRIGKKLINRMRRLDPLEHDDQYRVSAALRKESMGSPEFVEKDHLNDADMRNVAVARLDEKMLDLELSSDMNSPANIKAFNDLRDMKEMFLNHVSSGEGIYMDMFDASMAFAAQGDNDRDEIARGAMEFVGDIMNEAADIDAEEGQDDPTAATQRVIDGHNHLVEENAKRRRILEQKKQIAGISVRS
ncbi:hypothetical protein K8Z61_16365 [Nocardioides sp. TRM66260-LWL]|uniref:hypothetical protein n=1 Tax=Nocardioides sp. TRM66260-LWL TaxID=2874478 RepID=UPI001CC5D157|nr:hypothetical protein [Nocardioides sp. TRM66260-LWL]MBZ5736070.1 hypothetical protein [Nocardioides sp. TRM66260-LWL]